jgi:hypothetical protein
MIHRPHPIPVFQRPASTSRSSGGGEGQTVRTLSPQISASWRQAAVTFACPDILLGGLQGLRRGSRNYVLKVDQPTLRCHCQNGG